MPTGLLDGVTVLDLSSVGPAARTRVDVRVEIAELQLECEAELVEAGDGLAHGSNEGHTVGHVAHVIVGHLEDEQRSLSHRHLCRRSARLAGTRVAHDAEDGLPDA